jgi:hypothetical protein
MHCIPYISLFMRYILSFCSVDAAGLDERKKSVSNIRTAKVIRHLESCFLELWNSYSIEIDSAAVNTVAPFRLPIDCFNLFN